jgi:hypothetical protein
MLSSPLAAYAQTEQPMIHHHDHVRHYDGPHHIVHHHYGAHNPAPGPAPMAQRPGKPVESGPPQTNPMFKPYANPGDGDDDGLSRDPDDCNKGCVGGNPG